MTDSQILDVMQSAVMIATKLSAPILLICMGVGVLISILQAATQIHEQTITFVPKLILIAVVLVVTGPWMLATLQDFTRQLFSLMLE